MPKDKPEAVEPCLAGKSSGVFKCPPVLGGLAVSVCRASLTDASNRYAMLTRPCSTLGLEDPAKERQCRRFRAVATGTCDPFHASHRMHTSLLCQAKRAAVSSELPRGREQRVKRMPGPKREELYRHDGTFVLLQRFC